MALWWLVRAGVARVGLVGVPFACGGGRTCGGFGGFGAFEAWETAALNAYKQPLLRPWGALEPLFGGFEASQTAALNAYKIGHCCGRGVLLSHCCGLVVAFACSVGRGKEWRVLGLLGYLFPAELGGLLERLERLRPGKRQP